MSDVQIAPPASEPPVLSKTGPPFEPKNGNGNSNPQAPNLSNGSSIMSRKRKLETSEKENEPDQTSNPEKISKKLKWEAILRPKTGLNIEHAIYFNKDETSLFFENLEKEITYLSSSESSVTVYGKEYNVPRMVAAFGDNGIKYTYSRRTLAAAPWTPTLLKIKKEIESIKKTKYNFVLVNKYQNGEHNMGFHADDEDEIDQSTPICSVSLGASRDFTFLPKLNNDDKLTIALHDGTVLFMTEPTQKYWKHAIPKRRKVKTPRINLTFRRIFTDDDEAENEPEPENESKPKDDNSGSKTGD